MLSKVLMMLGTLMGTGLGSGRELSRGTKFLLTFTRIRHFLNAFHFVYIFPTPAYVLNVRSPTECCIDVNWTRWAMKCPFTQCAVMLTKPTLT